MNKIGYSILFLLTTVSAQATESRHSKHSQYVGQQTRMIKSLSTDDIDELRRGGGWGLAKAAELNGVPGPAHLLELKNEIPLTKIQSAELTKIHNHMKKRAIKLGDKLISLEQDLENQFLSGSINDSSLRAILNDISDVRMELRYVHLSTHLQTPEILTATQIEKYNRLRGYTTGDPCQSVPTGHNPEMWKKHNGCV